MHKVFLLLFQFWLIYHSRSLHIFSCVADLKKYTDPDLDPAFPKALLRILDVDPVLIYLILTVPVGAINTSLQK